MKVKILKLDKELPTPNYAYDGDAGTDLYSSVDEVVNPNEMRLVPCGIRWQYRMDTKCR